MTPFDDTALQVLVLLDSLQELNLLLPKYNAVLQQVSVNC